MNTPWDFPFPVKADTDPYPLYASVGILISEWESIEFNLSRLYGIFVDGDQDGQRIQEYGIPRIFALRMQGLQEVACKYFISSCNQKLEGEFAEICSHVEGYANRRNDIAHGIVMNISGIKFLVSKLHLTEWQPNLYLLVPPYYLLRKHPNGLPSYAYDSGQVDQISVRLTDLNKTIVNYRQKLRARSS